MTHDLTELKKYWQLEVIKKKPFKWRRLFRRYNESVDLNIKFWAIWRLLNEMYTKGNKKQKRIAVKMNNRLTFKFNVDIKLGAKIGICPHIDHFCSVIIGSDAKIGDYLNIRQNTTIGIKTIPTNPSGKYLDTYLITIGNNVFIGANSCIISDNIKIGDNVRIGAMTFINKNIPDNCTVYTEKTNKLVFK